jgi:hypothetical protein
MLRLLPREKGVLYCDIVFEVRDAKGSGDGATYSFMVARDVISDGITIPTGATLTVRYIFQVTT